MHCYRAGSLRAILEVPAFPVQKPLVQVVRCKKKKKAKGSQCQLASIHLINPCCSLEMTWAVQERIPFTMMTIETV